MSTKRVKPAEAQTIRDIGGLDLALLEYGQVERQIARIEAQMNEGIAAVTQAAAEQAAPMKARQQELETAILAYGESHRADLFAARKTVDLQHGQIGSLVSAELKPAARMTWKIVLGKCVELDQREAIKTTQAIDKEAMGRWPDERLALVGVQRIRKDTLWFKVRETKLDGGAP